MTEDYDVRHRGQLNLPPCMKQLMNCWEVIKPELFCKYGREYRQALESMCMDLRFQCVEFLGPQPFETLNVSNWAYCPPTRVQQDYLDLRPAAGFEQRTDFEWWRHLQTIPNYQSLGLIDGTVNFPKRPWSFWGWLGWHLGFTSIEY
ncbi:uncharacterized protein LOC125241921 [Leguminivora glycinivorella]|uniref:uncharacterized protein LOC125241921 n=1 Tax=Leguminivora glycinivorella TaxID=1035111 RepID=UPI00200F019F|nr:uncharacterized protein LOC125241921 [Leguminivora glycinivorella]